MPCLSVEIAEDPAISARGRVHDYNKWIEDLEGSETCDGQFILPVHVAEEVTGLGPISVEEYIEAQAADPWCQVMTTNADEAQGGEHRSMYSYVRLSIDRCTATYV